MHKLYMKMNQKRKKKYLEENYKQNSSGTTLIVPWITSMVQPDWLFLLSLLHHATTAARWSTMAKMWQADEHLSLEKGAGSNSVLCTMLIPSVLKDFVK